MDEHDREEIVAAILATGIVRKQTLPGQRGADPSPVYMVSLFARSSPNSKGKLLRAQSGVNRSRASSLTILHGRLPR